MAVLPIRRWPDPVLSHVCAPVAVPVEVAGLAQDMLETMYAAFGRGLAAPQVGVSLRLFVMDLTWKEGTRAPQVIVNPEILWRSDDLAKGPEGCLSIPGITTVVERAQTVRMRWAGLEGGVTEAMLTGFAAICAQHEYDHLNGIVTFDRLDPDARAKAEAEYGE